MRSPRIVSILFVVLAAAVGLRVADGGAGRPYLALGDSITFGFIANALLLVHPYRNPFSPDPAGSALL